MGKRPSRASDAPRFVVARKRQHHSRGRDRRGAGGGDAVREKEGCRQIPALSFSIPDFCGLTPEMGFEPIKSAVSRGLSPMETGWGRKRKQFSAPPLAQRSKNIV